MIADGRHWTTRVAAYVLGSLDVGTLNLRANGVHEFLGVDLRQREIDDALYAEGKSDDKGKGHQRHEAGTALDEFRLQLFVKSARLLGLQQFVLDNEI